jgi:uncharacterized protein YjbI with pentapeptide repeats
MPYADLRRVDARGADLRFALAEKTRFERTDLTHADLTGSNGLTPAQLCAARGFREALLPGDSASDAGPPFRIDEPGPLRQVAEKRCPLVAP